MTRDYNNQRRDNVRPFSRNSSPGRPGDERSPRPARPRPNRASVDRAWESGAPTHHADYRTRNNYGQPPRNNWRNNQPSEHPSAQYGRKPYGNRQDSYQRFERTPYGNAGPRSSSFDSDRRNFDDQRGNDRRSYGSGPNRNGARPDFRDNHHPRPYEQHPRYRGNEQNRVYQRRDSEPYERQSREFEHDNRPPRRFDRDHRSPREFDRDSRSPRNFERGNRPAYNSRPRDTSNPRWQSRPAAQRDNSYRERPDFKERAAHNERFEGDYERFDDREYQRRPPSRRPVQDSGPSEGFRPQSEERHVTRLPDGRVLKGPRPVQRRNAEFWKDIAQETENLVDQVESTPASGEVQTEVPADQQTAEVVHDSSPAEVQAEVPADQQTAEVVHDSSPEALKPSRASRVKGEDAKALRKPRTRAASAVAREKKAGEKKGKSAAKPRSTGSKPSQRGFKWPTP